MMMMVQLPQLAVQTNKGLGDEKTLVIMTGEKDV